MHMGDPSCLRGLSELSSLSKRHPVSVFEKYSDTATFVVHFKITFIFWLVGYLHKR